MNEFMQLEIKGEQDKLTVAGILVANGYTVRIVTVRDPNEKTKKVLQYKKEPKR